MSGLSSYKDFSKAAKDLLDRNFPAFNREKKTYENAWGTELELKPRADTKIVAGISNVTIDKSEKVNTHLKVEYKLKDYGATVTAEYKNEPHFDFTAAFDDSKVPVKGLTTKLHLHAKKDKEQLGGVELEFKHEHAVVTAHAHLPVTVKVFDFSNAELLKRQKQKFHLSGVVHVPDTKFYVGASGEFQNGDAFELTEAGFRAGFKDGSTQLVAGLNHKVDHEKNTKDNTVVVSALAKVNDVNVVVDGEYAVNAENPFAFTIGASFPLNLDATVKAKINSKKLIGFSYIHKLSGSTTFSFGTAFDVNDSANIRSYQAFKLSLTQ